MRNGTVTSTSLDLGEGRPRFGRSIVLPGWEGDAVPRAVRWGRVGERRDAKRVLVSRVPRGPNGHISQLFCTLRTVWHLSLCLESLVMLVRLFRAAVGRLRVS